MTVPAPSTPSMLSYNRSLVPTDAVFFAVAEGGVRRPIPILAKRILGTESQFDDAGQSKPTGNPQWIECATLPHECSRLGMEFILTVVGEAHKPQACDLPEWRADLIKLVESYVQADGFRTLGRLYAANLANGRWAWKNRLFAQDFAITVVEGKQQWHFAALQHRLSDLDGSTRHAEVISLGDRIAAGLRGEAVVRLTVTGLLDMGHGTTVYPSQEFVDKDDDKDNNKDDSKKKLGKVLFGINYQGEPRCAAFHEQKIGNALRTIDIWHGGTEGVEPGMPLPVNPYGQDREAFVVVRRSGGGNSDFYTLLTKGIKSFAPGMANGVSGDMHFVLANLVRGGVFGMGKKSNEPGTAKTKAK
ncbi:MAG: type I-F CRISPR-associated protein Csy3 [Magnetococcus sp. DMHC-8]